MKYYYISKECLEETIEYFKNLEIKNPEQLGLFLFLKKAGLENEKYNEFKKAGQMSDEEKKVHEYNLHRLGGVFSLDEKPGKYTCLFPFSINSSVKGTDFFNGGSRYNQLISRITDTMDNTLVDKYLKKNPSEHSQYKFINNYIDYIKENFLVGQKISLTYFSIWINRFIKFEIKNDESLSLEEFKNICIKETIRYLNFNELELKELFYTDSNKIEVSYADEPILGADLRDLITFETEPEIIKEESSGLDYENRISWKEVEEMKNPTGNNPSIEEIKNVLEKKKQIILYGVPGTGKSRIIKDLKQDDFFNEIKNVQFHPSYSYEEFIGGKILSEGKIETKAGVFLQACKKAERYSDRNILFFIDEINRGNISRIFGETIQILDRDYAVELPQEYYIEGEKIDEISIPSNLYIVGTMNSTDRSIALLDFAIRRRFGFVKIFPNYEVIGKKNKLLETSNGRKIDLERLYKTLNERILNILQDENLLIGHSFLLPSWFDENDKYEWTIDDLRIVFNYTILPTLEEYTFENKDNLIKIVGERLNCRILDNDEFENALNNAFSEAFI